MKTDLAANAFELRAAEALKVLLEQVSAIKLREMHLEPPARGSTVEIVASIEVLGHSHTLACEANRDTRPGKVRASLRKLQASAAHRPGQTTPVLIAPYLSPEAQTLCKQSHAGFLDLEGNARLSLGEVFIGTRSLHQHPAAQSMH